MAEYTLRDPQSGRTITVRGDSPPTEQEAEQLFAYAQSPTAAPTQAASVAPTPAPMENRSPLDSTGSVGAAMGLGVPEWITNRSEGPNTYRFGPALAAAMAYPPARVGQVASGVLSAVAGLGGEHIAQAIEGERKPADLARGALFNLVPQFAGTRSIVKDALRGLIYTTSAEMASETIGRSIEEGRYATYKNMSELKPVIPAALIGAAMGTASEIRPTAIDRELRKKVFADAGVFNPTLDMLIPSKSDLGAKVRAHNREIMEEYINSERPVVEVFQKLFPEATTNESVREALKPYLGKVDAAERAHLAAKETAIIARQTLDDAIRNISTAPDQINKLRNGAIAAELNAINAKAARTLERTNTFGSMVSDTSVADSMVDIVGSLKAHRKEKSNALYKAAGINKELPQFRVGDLYTSAKVAVSREGSKDQAKEILAKIESMADPKMGGDTLITMNQVEELRGKFSDLFAGKDMKTLSSGEALAARAYGAITGAMDATVVKTLPPERLKAWREAVSYYAQTSQAMNSRYAKAILNKEPLDNVFKTLATDIAGGSTSEYRAFNMFISAVAKDSPEVAALAQKQFTLAIKNSVLTNAKGAAGDSVNIRRAVQILDNFPNEVPVGSLGFGSKKDVKEWARLFKSYGVHEVDAEVLNEAFTSSAFQEAVIAGKGVASAARPVAARIAFENNVRLRLIEDAVGVRKDLAHAGRVNRLAREANLDEAAKGEILKKLEADPIMMEFAGGESWGVSPTASGGGKEIINSIINAGERGERLLRTIRVNNPKVSDLLEARYMSEQMRSFFRPAQSRVGATWEVNRQAVEAFFDGVSVMPTDTPEGMAKAFIRPDRLASFKKVVGVFSVFNDMDKKAGISATSASGEIARALGMTQSLFAGDGFTAATMKAAGMGKIEGWYKTTKWKALTAMIGDNKFANAFWRADGSAIKALDAVGPGKAYNLLRQHPLLQELAAEEADGNN